MLWDCALSGSKASECRGVRTQAIMLALDRKEREREMVSLLLAELHPRVLSEREVGEGFTAVMLSCEVMAPASLSYVL